MHLWVSYLNSNKELLLTFTKALFRSVYSHSHFSRLKKRGALLAERSQVFLFNCCWLHIFMRESENTCEGYIKLDMNYSSLIIVHHVHSANVSQHIVSHALLWLQLWFLFSFFRRARCLLLDVFSGWWNVMFGFSTGRHVAGAARS